MKQKRWQIILDVSHVQDKHLTSIAGLKKFLVHLTHTIGMNVLKGPIVANGIPENPGLSGVVIIDFSHISVHTFTDTHEALVDIFSCKPYDQKIAIDETAAYFHVTPGDVQMKKVSWG